MTERPDLKVEPGASLRMLAVARIRAEISEGRIPPGARLIERDLCAALGVSRTVIREAIRQLEAEGYVAQAPRRGPIVAPLDLETIRSIYEAREVLEAKASALFVERASEADRARVVAIYERLRRFAREGDEHEALAILDELHSSVLESCGNTMFASLLAPMRGRIHMLRMQAVRSPERRLEAVRQRGVIVAALCGNDPEAAAEATRECLNASAAFAISRYSENGFRA